MPYNIIIGPYMESMGNIAAYIERNFDYNNEEKIWESIEKELVCEKDKIKSNTDSSNISNHEHFVLTYTVSPGISRKDAAKILEKVVRKVFKDVNVMVYEF